MNFLKSLFKATVPSVFRNALRRWLAPYRLRQSWLSRKTTKDDDHLTLYWNAEHQPNRKQLIFLLVEEIKRMLEVCTTSISVLEYGSHVGLNLKLLNDVLPLNPQTAYFAVEPNAEAVAFLIMKLPFVQVLRGEDEVFCRQTDFPPEGRYLSFVNSVFYAMEARRAKAALARICSFSDVVVLGESIVNVDGSESRMRNHPECFEHPYRRWLDALGFEIVSLEQAPDPRPQLNGFIVARRRET